MEKQKINETETQLISIYLCQMLGCPTVLQIKDVMKNKMGLTINETKIKNSLNSAKKRGLLSVNHTQNPDTGEVEDSYSMKDMRFSNPPEVAHIKNVLPKLLEDDGAKEIYDMMEGEHTEGKKKGGRLPDIRDYVTWKVTFINVLPMLGGQPFSNGDSEVKATNKFRRVGKQIWIPGNLWLKGAIKDMLRVYNINGSKAMYIRVTDYFFNPSTKIYQENLPSPAQRAGGAGTGITSFEALNPGEEFEFDISFPTTSGIPEDTMKKILSNGIRIGARHKDYGLLKVKKITPLS